MQRSIHARPGLGVALHVVQEGGIPLRHVLVDFPSLILVYSGRKEIRSGRAVYIAKEGELLAVAAGTEIEVTNALPAVGPYKAICLSFDPQLCGAVGNLGSDGRTVSTASPLGRPPGFLLSAFRRAAESCASAHDVPDCIVRHQLQEVLLGVETLGWRFDVRGATRLSVRIRRLLNSGPDKRWKIREVGKVLGMSEATLRRRLDEEKTSFREILGQVRMGRALMLLQSSELSVAEVAYETGYESVSQFTAKFRRHFAQSPSRLRQGSAGMSESGSILNDFGRAGDRNRRRVYHK